MITKTNQSLSEVFDVTPESAMTVSEQIVEDVDEMSSDAGSKHDKDRDADFELARATMHSILLIGQQSLKNAAIIADGTEEPDSYNAVSSLISRITDASTKLMGLHDMKMKLTTKPTAPVAPTTTTGNGNTTISGPVVFVGSTTEMSRMARMVADKHKHSSIDMKGI